VDRAFINYTPHQFKPLTLTGGKFAYPWYNTELTWAKDLNPEGVAQTLAFNLESTPVLKRIASEERGLVRIEQGRGTTVADDPRRRGGRPVRHLLYQVVGEFVAVAGLDDQPGSKRHLRLARNLGEAVNKQGCI
jgi:hypothetical protein